MYPTNGPYVRYYRWLQVAVIVGLLLLSYRLFVTVWGVTHSGTLVVTAPAPGTVLSITQGSHAATYIGSRTAQVRLAPGDYVVGASASGVQTTKAVTVTKGHTSVVNINPATPAATPENRPTGFINFDVLVNHGISTTQETTLEQLFSQYAPKAQIVSLDGASVKAEPHDPNKDGANFALDFTGNIDTKPFAARMVYSGDEAVSLTLTNPQTGVQLFTYTAPATPDV